MDARGTCNYRALHNTHAPFEVPKQYSSLYNYSLPLKNTWAGMVSMVDETVANVTRTLQSTKLWSNTLLVVAGDNGSPVCGWLKSPAAWLKSEQLVRSFHIVLTPCRIDASLH